MGWKWSGSGAYVHWNVLQFPLSMSYVYHYTYTQVVVHNISMLWRYILVRLVSVDFIGMCSYANKFDFHACTHIRD